MALPFEMLWALAVAAFVFSLKPGPGIATAISYSLSHGTKGLLAFLAGFNVGLGAYLIIVFIGLMGINLIQVDMVFIGILIKSLASVYLIFIGVKEILKSNMPIEHLNQYNKEQKTKTLFEIAMSAMILTISNPMVIVFYAALIPSFIDPSILTFPLIILVFVMLMAIDSVGMVIYCAPILLFRKTLSQNIMQKVKLLSGVFIIFIGLLIGYTALPSKDLLSVF